MSSQSSVYDDSVDCFDKLDLNDSFNGTNSCVNTNSDKTNDNPNDNSNDDPVELDKDGYLEDYFKIENQHKLQSQWTIWYSKL